MTRLRMGALAWAVVVAMLLAHNGYLWLVKRVIPNTDIMALLPVEEHDPLLQQAFTQMVDAGQQRLFVLVGAPDWDGATRAADAYQAVLARHPDLLQAGEDSPDAMEADGLALLQPHRSALLTAADARDLRERPASWWVDAALSKLYSPFGGLKVGTWQDDPFGLFGNWVQERAGESRVRPRDGRLFVAEAGRSYVLLPYALQGSALSFNVHQALMPVLVAARAAANQTGAQTEVIETGVVLHAAAASAQAKREMSTIGAGALLGIVTLLWLSFGSIRPIGLIMLSIGVGCLGALSVCWLLFGKIHIMTLVFGASLIGVAQDYGIYFMCKRMGSEPGLDSAKLLRRLLPGLSLTLAAAVTGYMGLALTPFPGLRQMAVFSAFGLLFAWLTVVFWFPMLVQAGTLQSTALSRWYGASLRHWPRPGSRRVGLMFGLLAVILVGLAAWRVSFNDDIRLLQNSPPHLIEDQVRLGRLLDTPAPAQFFLVRGDQAETVLQREEALAARLDGLVAAGLLSGYQAMSNWVPSLQMQAARRELYAQTLLAPQGPLASLAQQLGEDSEWPRAIAARLLVPGAADPLVPAAFLALPIGESSRHLWLGSGEGGVAGIVALRGLSQSGMAQVRLAADGLDGVQWVDKVGGISEVLSRYRIHMGQVLLLAYFAVFLLLWIRYRWRAWRVMLPTALASVATLSILALLGQPLNLFHVLALMLMLGIGVDYGIFFQERQPGRAKPEADRAAWLAVGLSAISTLLAFGLLSLSQTPALHAFGLTVLIGVALVWLIVPFFGAPQIYDTPDGEPNEH